MYFVSVFAAGFIMGAVRVSVLAPRLGEFAATLLELPVILAVSWIASAAICARLAIGALLSRRLVMGLVAFTLLMLAEAGLSLLMLGRSLADHVAAYRSPAGAAGLAAQVLFAAMPALQLRRRH